MEFIVQLCHLWQGFPPPFEYNTSWAPQLVWKFWTRENILPLSGIEQKISVAKPMA
jgi:hypothetical protein